MKNFKLIDFLETKPETSAYYYTDKGFLKYDKFTRSFYDENNSSPKVKYWFDEIKTFEDSSKVLIKYLCKKHHPHTTVIVTSTNSELLEGTKSTGKVLEFLKD
ncbi:hypothetical protein EGI16_10770 [Chryseobacterium sp. G0240]|uniref:hypothetical protein n=1 Tax=Chryseobacterium sp. G0240 TaxID=2487066 RepID=UPI000F446D92|nr:hypothetical protein [Chryseobacterium sp. G0240]ROI03688.1 hypothetical protein EGI16_10770 [Chryseobacterium sp. G0240]